MDQEPIRTRAYSLITVKEMDDKTRILEGIASTPTADRMDDVVLPLGAKFKLPLPFLWQHQHSKPIGHVIEADATAKGITFKAQLAQTDEPGLLKDELDYAWQSIKLKLVPAVSIGFSAHKYAWMDNGGIEFQEWEWYELSAVTIPANAEATINSIKSMDAATRHALGMIDPKIPLPPKLPATGKALPVVKLDATARDRAPYVLRTIHRLK